jgi:chaperonin GroEL
MAARQLIFGEEARRALGRGADAVSNAVRVTLGPKGRNVMLDRGYGSPLITKDGVTVASQIELEDPAENMGAQLIKEVASKTNDVTGDGTTTATVLAQSIVHEGLRYVMAGGNPLLVKKGIETAVKRAVQELQAVAIPVKGCKEQVASVAGIAGNDLAIGRLIADAIEKVGQDGVITIEESKSMQTTTEFVDGMQFDKGYISPYFVTNTDRMEAIAEHPYILLCETKISITDDLIPILEQVSKEGRSLVIIAEDVSGNALSTLVINKIRGNMDSIAVKSPGFGDRRKLMMEDLAILTGGKFISSDLGIQLENVDLSMLGQADRIIVTKDQTTIISGCGGEEAIKNRIHQLRRELEEAESSYDKDNLQGRLAKLSGGVAVIKVGAATETEMAEIKHRFEDALSATRAALDEGIVAGGGAALLAIQPALNNLPGSLDEQHGIAIVRRALEEPLRRIAENAGFEGSVVVNHVRTLPAGYGFDALSEEYCSLVEAGIVDPVKVTRFALEHAASIAGLILTTETVIVEGRPVHT